MTERPYLVSLVELAKQPGMPCQTTLRNLIRDNPDFPVVSWGQHGIAHEIDLAAAIQWFRERNERLQHEERLRSEEIGQMSLELLGDGAAARITTAGQSSIERRQMAELELVALKVAERRSQLVWRDSVVEAADAVLAIAREHASGFCQRLSSRVSLSPDMITAIEKLMAQDLAAFADGLAKVCALGTDAGANDG